MPGREAIDCGLDLKEPVPLDIGLCCQDKVPLRDSAVALVGGLGIGGFSLRDNAAGREKSSEDTGVLPGFGELDPARPRVRDCEGGVKATGGSIPCLGLGVVSPTSRKEGVGPVLEGERDRARSVECQCPRWPQ